MVIIRTESYDLISGKTVSAVAERICVPKVGDGSREVGGYRNETSTSGAILVFNQEKNATIDEIIEPEKLATKYKPAETGVQLYAVTNYETCTNDSEKCADKEAWILEYSLTVQ